jgi:oxygen-independent coproporphyrinogen-3 oxidase
MAGIYIHIPYCKSKCIYCDFYSSTDFEKKNELINAICLEIKNSKDIFPYQIETIYIGGGTPSVLNSNDLEKIVNALFNAFNLSTLKEFTIEVNPDDITEEFVRIVKNFKINRVSIGVQSFDDDILKFLSRRHNSKQAINAVELFYKAGFNNISIDLIYGINGLSESLWKKTLTKAISLPIKHLSAYHLTIEENTILHKKLLQNLYKEINEENSLKQYEILKEILSKNNFEHYEISNFAKDGYQSKHNCSYWQGKPYLGIGPSAHSYFINKRRYNYYSIDTYVENVSNKKQHFVEEHLSNTDKFNEYLITRLRTNKGGSFEELKKIDEAIFYKWYRKLNLNKIYLNINNDNFSLKEEFWFISNSIISKLLI